MAQRLLRHFYVRKKACKFLGNPVDKVTKAYYNEKMNKT